MAEGISVPALNKGERVEDWQPLFEGATASLRRTEEGTKKALQMLPSFI